MEFDQEFNGFVGSSVCHEESRRFRDKEDGDEDDYTCESLEDEWDLPREVRVDVVCSVCHGSGGDGSSKPSTIVEPYNEYRAMYEYRSSPVHLPRQ